MNDQFTQGVIEDPRPQEARDLDYKHEETAYAAIPVVWTEVPQEQWPKYSLKNQDGSGSCGGQAGSKAMEVLFGVPCSAAPLYRYRTNYPAAGMWAQDLGNNAKNKGTVSESDMPSQLMNDEQMNQIGLLDGIDPSKIYKIGGYFFVSPQNIDGMAQICDLGFPIVFSFQSTYAEWCKNVPEADSNTPITDSNVIRHFNCIPKFRTLYNGKKAFISEESWGLQTTVGDGGQRILTEDFIMARLTSAMYFVPPAPAPVRQTHVFEVDLKQHDTDATTNGEISWLQKCLIYEGCLAPEFVTGNFLSHTLQGVMKFQTKYASEILEPAGLKQATGFVGEHTRSKLNQLFGN